MPRSAGTYTLTANAHAISGNTILSAPYNNLLDDLAAEMTNSLARDGQGGMTGALKGAPGSAPAPSYTFSADLDTGFYNYSANSIGVAIGGVATGQFTSDGWVGNVVGQVNGGDYADVASATTTDIGAVASKNINITGTTTITGLGTVAAGTEKSLKFAGVLTLTHNGTSLIIPGAANITTAAGDTAEVISLGSGNWRVKSYTKASGYAVTGLTIGAGLTGAGTVASPLVANVLTLGTTVATTSGTTVDFTSIPAGTKRITVMINSWSHSSGSNTALLLQIGDGSIVTSGYVSTAGLVSGGGSTLSTSTAGFLLTTAMTATNPVCGLIATLVHMGSNVWVCASYGAGSTTAVTYTGGGNKTLSGVLDRVRLTTDLGSTFDAGSVNILYE